MELTGRTYVAEVNNVGVTSPHEDNVLCHESAASRNESIASRNEKRRLRNENVVCRLK